jgi:hypothetical protein
MIFSGTTQAWIHLKKLENKLGETTNLQILNVKLDMFPTIHFLQQSFPNVVILYFTHEQCKLLLSSSFFFVIFLSFYPKTCGIFTSLDSVPFETPKKKPNFGGDTHVTLNPKNPQKCEGRSPQNLKKKPQFWWDTHVTLNPKTLNLKP